MGAYRSNPQQQQQQTATYSAYNAYDTYNNTYNLIPNQQLSDVNLHNTIATTTANDTNPRTLNRDGNVINANNKINYQSLNVGNSHSVISQPSTHTISSIINSNQFDNIGIKSHLNKSKNKQSINKGDAYLNNVTTEISPPPPINSINNNSFRQISNAGGDDKSSKIANSNPQVNNNINSDCNNTNNATNSANDTISQYNSNSTHQIIRHSKLSAIQGGAYPLNSKPVSSENYKAVHIACELNNKIHKENSTRSNNAISQLNIYAYGSWTYLLFFSTLTFIYGYPFYYRIYVRVDVAWIYFLV